MRGFVVTILLLTGLQALVDQKNGANGPGQFHDAVTGLAAVIRRVTSPAVAAIPDLRVTKGSGDWGATPSSSTSTATTAPAVLPAPLPTRPTVPTIYA